MGSFEESPSTCFLVIGKSPSTGRWDPHTSLELELPVVPINSQMMEHPALGALKMASPLEMKLGPSQVLGPKAEGKQALHPKDPVQP